MNKRLRKKKINQLTEDEVKVIKLYRSCSNVSFYMHDHDDVSGSQFASIIGDVKHSALNDETDTFESRKGKISACAFVKVQTEG